MESNNAQFCAAFVILILAVVVHFAVLCVCINMITHDDTRTCFSEFCCLSLLATLLPSNHYNFNARGVLGFVRSHSCCS